MQITDKTLYKDFFILEDVLTEESEKSLLQASQAKYKDYYDLTIGELFAIMAGDVSLIDVNKDKPEEITALQAFWLKHFKNWLDTFIKTIETYALPMTAEARQASLSCLKPSFNESVILFMREYFGLHSFDEVYKLKVTDYILAKRDAYNKAMFEMAITKITTSKMSKK